MNIKKTFLFLALAFAISWISAGILYLADIPYGSTTSVIVVATAYMMAPAIAAIIVHKGIYKEEIRLLGLDFKKTRWKQLLWLPVINILFCSGAILIILLFGNMLGLNGFGIFSLDEALLRDKMTSMLSGSGAPPMPALPIPPWLLLAVVLVFASVLGGILNTLFTFGEELGWRGLLFNETIRLGFMKSNLLTGFVWGAWHAPLILQGHNYPQHPVAGIGMMIVLCTGLSFLMSWARLRTGTVLGPSVLHGMVNATAGGVMLFVYHQNDLIGSIAGLAGAVSALVLGLFLWRFDRASRRLAAEH